MSKVYEAYMKELERSYEYDEAYYWYQLAQKESEYVQGATATVVRIKRPKLHDKRSRNKMSMPKPRAR